MAKTSLYIKKTTYRLERLRLRDSDELDEDELLDEVLGLLRRLSDDFRERSRERERRRSRDLERDLRR